MGPMALTLDAMRAARAQLHGIARVTPVAPAGYLTDLVGGDVWLKCENLQVAGSFKVRGAYTRMARLGARERAAGVVAASAGNHAQGVAVAARALGLAATVFMPVTAPLPKLAATRGYGARVEFAGDTIDDALEAAAEFADRTGAIMVHPFDHHDIVLGQATVGLEILEQVPDVRTIVVCTGGGGLVAGIASAVAASGSIARVVGVQAVAAAAYPASLAAGHPVPLERMATMADGIAVGRPGEVPFGVIRDLGVEIRTVDEESLSRALLTVLERGKLLVEPAGAAAVAALMHDATGLEPPVVAVLSGGNVDPLLLTQVLHHGLVAAGRYLDLNARIPDHPGGLAALLTQVAELGANVIGVDHVRSAPDLGMGEVDVSVHLETRGPAHRDAVTDGLLERGFRVLVGGQQGQPA